MAAYEDSGEVFLRGFISSVRGRSYPALQELDSPSFLPGSNVGRDSKLQGYGFQFNDWIQRGLFGDGVRPARETVRPLGRRIKSCLAFSHTQGYSIKLFMGFPKFLFIGFPVNSHGRAKNE